MNAPDAEREGFAELSFLVSAFQVSKMIQVAVALGIADSLHDGPKPATKLVTDSGADANMVLRLCRALSAFGIFEVDSEDMVGQSARSAWLRKDARPTLHHAALYWMTPGSWSACGAIKMAKEGHGPDGRFLKGHKRQPNSGRPLGSVNKISKSVNAEVREGLGSIAEAVKELRKTNLSAVVPLIRHMMLSADADAAVGSLGLPADIIITTVPVGHHFHPIDALTLCLFNADEAQQVSKLQLNEDEAIVLFNRRFIKLNGKICGLFTADEMQWAKSFVEQPSKVEQPQLDLSNVTVLKPTGNV